MVKMVFSASNRCWTLEKNKKTKFKSIPFSCNFYIILYLILTEQMCGTACYNNISNNEKISLD